MGYSGFYRAASAICYSIARERCGADIAFPANRVVRFVRAQHARMPDYLRFPLRTLTVLFDLGAIVTSGRRFHRLDHARRWRRIERWRRSRLGPCRDLVRFYEALVVFCSESIRHER